MQKATSAFTSVVLVLVAALPSSADIPDPVQTYAPPVLTVSPDGTMGYTVEVHGFKNGPVPGVMVELQFGAQTDGLVSWCAGQSHPVLTGVTDTMGRVTFFVQAGGCIDQVPAGDAYIAQVLGDGILLQEMDAINSPDVVNTAGRKPLEEGASTCESGQATVGLSDAVYHTGPIALGLQDVCTKFVTPYDAPVGLADAVLVTASITDGTTCACD